jgi:general L-amino acid transport system permease protein
VAALVGVVVMWLAGNYRTNTAAIGIPTSYEFLGQPTSFDIPGVEFDPQERILNAYLVGIANTIKVAVVGIGAATVVGVLLGIGRLSANWVVNRLAAVYVEVIRNLPVAVILVFTVLVVVLQVFPRIQEAWTPLGAFVISNRGMALPWYRGVGWAGLLAVSLVGVTGWVVIARWRRWVSDSTGAPARTGLLGGGFLLAAMALGWVVLGAEVSLPAVEGRRITGGLLIDPSYFAILVALVVYTSSHIAEIVRGSIQAIDRGQSEAASALALSTGQRMWHVILPQAMRIAIPPLGNQYLNLIKNSSLAAAFAYFDITNVTQVTVGNGSPAVPAFTLALFFYLVLSLVTSLLVNVGNRRFRLVER